MPSTHDVQEESLAVNVDVQFWGVRDQIPTPGEDTVRYGGNTSCVELRIDNHCLVFDGGTGLRILGNNLLTRMPVEAHIFFTHCHWDRIQGFPFFVPAFIPINHFHIYGANASNGSTFQQRLSKQMLGPNFPVPIQVMQSKLEFHDLNDLSKRHIGDHIVIESCLLNDHHRSVGYRTTIQDKAIVYAMSPDDCLESASSPLFEFARNADLLMLAAPRATSAGVPLELESRDRLHHNIKTAKDVGVKQIILSLHNPDHSDDYLDHIESKLQTLFPNLSLAREGMVIPIAS